jgi:hypothetical protein
MPSNALFTQPISQLKNKGTEILTTFINNICWDIIAITSGMLILFKIKEILATSSPLQQLCEAAP